MSETLAAPILDPSELSPEDMDAIHEAERVINESLDRYIAVADTPNARKDVTESIERQATADPKAFLAAREQLSNFTDEDDPTDEQIEKEDVLKDVLDGPVRARTVTKYGVFTAPTAEVRARVERAIANVRDAESTEGKMARRISTMNTSNAHKQSYGNAMANLSVARETNDAAAIETYSFAVRHLRRTMDIQSGNTGNTQKELDSVDAWIARINAADVPDDDHRMKEEQAQALRDARHQRAEAQEDLERVQRKLRETPLFSAREKLRNLLDEHPEGIDVIHSLENAHIGFSSGEKVDKCYEEKRDKYANAQEKVRELQGTLPAGDGRIALAQIAEFKAREAFNEVDRHHSKDRETAEFLGNLADENAIDKRVREEQDKAMGNLGEIMDSATEALFEWQHKGKAISEHGAFVGVKKVEAYISALDEKIALAQRSDRRLPHYRALRDEAFDSYLQLQYHKELVRTEMFANAGDFEGRHGLAHTPDKGILLERSNGAFIIYPDGTYCSVYENEAGEPQRTPRVNAQGEVVTTPVLEPINDPRDLVDSAMIRGWESMTLDNLKDVDAAVHGAWIRDPANTTARAQLEIVSGLIRERTAHEENTLTHMEVSYMEHYLAVGRDGNADRLMPDGSVAGHMTLHGLEGDWLLHPNGAADLYTPGTTEPVSRYAPDGTILNTYGPEEDPTAPLAPEDPDGGSGEGGPDEEEEAATPSAPIPTPAPTPVPAPIPSPSILPGRPGAVGGVRHRPGFLTRPEGAPADSGEADEPDEPGTVSGAGGAPTPPTPPSPEEPAAAPKPERRKPQPITSEERKVVNEAITNALAESVIYTAFDTLARGPITRVKGGMGVSNENARKRLETDSAWTEEDVRRYNVAPESIVYIPEDDVFGRFQYRYEPREGQDPSTRLVVDARVPGRVASELIGEIMNKPEIARLIARTFYESHFGKGSWVTLGRPPYERLKDAELTVAMADPSDKSQFVTHNYPIGG
jgi:hypothetical protein